MLVITRVAWLALALHFIAATANAQPTPQIICGPAHVVDGDGMVIDGTAIRLLGVDAPETDQRCYDDKCEAYTCGIVSRDRLDAHIAGRTVCCVLHRRGAYNRTIGTCSVDGEDLNAWQVSEGLAIADENYSRKYVGQQKVIVSRIVRLFKDHDDARQVAMHLKLRRNATVHAARSPAYDEVDAVLLQAETLVGQILYFYIQQGKFRNQQELIDFLDLSMNQEHLLRHRQLISQFIKYQNR
jgi:endonuclease YncB( thermonuclease family)